MFNEVLIFLGDNIYWVILSMIYVLLSSYLLGNLLVVGQESNSKIYKTGLISLIILIVIGIPSLLIINILVWVGVVIALILLPILGLLMLLFDLIDNTLVEEDDEYIDHNEDERDEKI